MAQRRAIFRCLALALAAVVVAGCQHRPGPHPCAASGSAPGAWALPAAHLRSIEAGATYFQATRDAKQSAPSDGAPSPVAGQSQTDQAGHAEQSPVRQVAAIGLSAEPPVEQSEPAPVFASRLAQPQKTTWQDVEDLKGPPTPALGLNDAIEMALTRNPDLVTARQAEGVSEAMLGVAGAHPFNPTFQSRCLPYSQFVTGQPAAPAYYFLLWQQFELAHQRRYRQDSASAALDAVRWNIQQAQLANVAMTEQLYFAALYQRGLRELVEMTAAVNDKLLTVMEKRLGAGKASAAEVAVARLDARSARQQARVTGVTFHNALLALRRHLNLPVEALVEIEGDLAEFTWHAVTGQELCQLLSPGGMLFSASGPNQLAAELAAGRPDVLAARQTANAAAANLSLSRAARVPNLWIGPFYSHDAERILNAGFQAQFDIPVCNTGKPLVRQREAELQQQRTAAEQLEAKARIDIRTALDRYEQARQSYEQARQDTGLQLPEELQKLEAEFERGEIDILRITQARTSLIQWRRSHLDSLNELALAAAALTAVSGLPPAAMISFERRLP